MAGVLLVGWGSMLENKIIQSFASFAKYLHVDIKGTCNIQITAPKIQKHHNTIVSNSTFVLCLEFPIVLQHAGHLSFSLSLSPFLPLLKVYMKYK